MTNLVFCVSGLLAVFSQTLLLRELFAVYNGNELSLGIILSLWLAGSSLGSRFFVHNAPRGTDPRRALALSFAASGAYLVLSFFLVRNLRNLLNLLPGETVALSTIFWSSAVLLVPLGLFSGSQFSLSLRAADTLAPSVPARRAYLLEAAGWLSGGLVFTFLLLPYFSPAAIALLCLALCLLAASALSKGTKLLPVLGISALLLLAALPFTSARLERYTLSRAFNGFVVKEAVFSPSAQHAVLQKNGELFFYCDGFPLFGFPGTDRKKTEEFACLPLLFSPRPKNVLLLGNTGKFLPALAERGIDRLDCIEQDRLMAGLLERHAPEYFRRQRDDSRIRVLSLDGSRFLKTTGTRYDVILLGLPYPLNLNLNRYYTSEFFALARQRLSPRGILALALPGSNVDLDPATRDLNRAALNTLKSVFKTVRIIPGEDNLFLASDAPLAGKATLKKRFSSRAKGALFISPAYLDHALNAERTYELRKSLEESGTASPSDKASAPAALSAALVFWQSVFASKSAPLYQWLAQHAFLLWLPVLLYLLGSRNGAAGTAFTSGAAGMGLQMLGIWGLQAARGTLYHWIGLLTASFMAGLSLGSWLSTENREQRAVSSALLMVESVFCLFVAAGAVLARLYTVPWQAYFLFSAGAGVFLGLEFPLLAAYAASSGKTTDAAAAGRVYSADLAGGTLAALLFGTFLIPVWGFEKALLFILSLKLASAAWWGRKKAAGRQA
ncbi:MAG: spermine/spermidine synthase domain-containing protein [Endomicrobiales bacterium]